MSSEFEDLAQSAANVLVSAIVTDSWEAVKRRFVAVVGHERQIDATRADLATKHGPERADAQAELARAWVTRLRDVLEDQPGIAPDLRALVASLGSVTIVVAISGVSGGLALAYKGTHAAGPSTAVSSGPAPTHAGNVLAASSAGWAQPGFGRPGPVTSRARHGSGPGTSPR